MHYLGLYAIVGAIAAMSGSMPAAIGVGLVVSVMVLKPIQGGLNGYLEQPKQLKTGKIITAGLIVAFFAISLVMWMIMKPENGNAWLISYIVVAALDFLLIE